MSFRSRTRATGVFYVPGFPKGVKWLLISNVAVFLIGFFAQLVQLDGPLQFLALTPEFVIKYFFIWQLATYMFLHAGFGHIIWNMLALWMFGADLGWTETFPISTGFFSHWIVWVALAIGLKFGASVLAAKLLPLEAPAKTNRP